MRGRGAQRGGFEKEIVRQRERDRERGCSEISFPERKERETHREKLLRDSAGHPRCGCQNEELLSNYGQSKKEEGRKTQSNLRPLQPQRESAKDHSTREYLQRISD